MNDSLNEAQEILNDLENDLAKTRTLWKQIEMDNPGFDPVSEEHWKIRCARSWLHGATDVRESNQLEKWIFDHPPLSETAKSSASKCIKYWREWLVITKAYYEPFEDFEFEKPRKGESLISFILRMSKIVEEEGPCARLEWRALKSFLAYLRNIAMNEIAFIEQIFPQKMDVMHGRILRKIAPEVPSIPEEMAGTILTGLAHKCRFGPRNAHLTAAESLGLSWLCLTASRLRLPIHLKILKGIKITSLRLDGEFPTLLIPTFFGDRCIRISNRVAQFLHALSLIPSIKPRETILQSPFRSLTRTFAGVVEDMAPNPAFGNITYVSLLSPPHYFGNQRYQPKQLVFN